MPQNLTPQNKRVLVATLLGAGLILISLSVYFSIFSKRQLTNSIVLARVERELGKSYIYSSGFSKRELINETKDLINLDSVETLETGEVRILFENGYVLNLESNTLVSVEKNSDSNETVVILSRGELRIEKIGRDPQFFISRNGQKILAKDYSLQKLEDLQTNSIKPAEIQHPETGNKTQLAEEEIHTLLNGQRSSFFKCYAQLLQTTPDAKGMLTLNFVIEPSGHIQQPAVDSKDLTDKNFQKCLIETLKRLEFRSFAGPSVSTLFPMKFE